jgi:hypothetical protein
VAGDWIKIRKDLIDDPAVICIAKDLDCSREEVVGILVRFWSWVDSHVSSGNHVKVTNVTVDELVGHEGFAVALEKAGWASFKDVFLKIPHFERHLSQNAKRRALNAEKVKRWRNQNVTQNPAPEKRREDERCNNPLPPKRGKCPGPPIDWNGIIGRFNQVIAPILRCGQVEARTDKREAHLRKRLEEHPDLIDRIEAEARRTSPKYLGDPTVEQSIKFIDFDWLTKSADNIAKFLEGKYRRKDLANVRPQPTEEELAAAFIPPTGIKTHRDHPLPPAARGGDLDGTKREDSQDHKVRPTDGSGLSPLFEFGPEAPGNDA